MRAIGTSAKDPESQSTSRPSPSVARLTTLQDCDVPEDLALKYEVETRELRGHCYPLRPSAHLVSSTHLHTLPPEQDIIDLASHARSEQPSSSDGLSRHSFTQILERFSVDSFDSHTTPSAHVSRSDVLTLADMQRIALGSSRTWSTPRPIASSTWHAAHAPAAARLRATSKR